MKDKSKLFKEKRLLYKRIDEINEILEIQDTKNKISIEEVAFKVKEFTGIEVKNIGKHCLKSGKIAKQIFWRAGFNECISGTLLSNYTGDKSRYAAGTGRHLHKQKCKSDPLLELQWNQFKKFIKQ